MAEFRVVIALDLQAEDKDEARAFAKDIAIEQVGRKKRKSLESARAGGYRSDKKLPYVFQADVIEVRDH